MLPFERKTIEENNGCYFSTTTATKDSRSSRLSRSFLVHDFRPTHRVKKKHQLLGELLLLGLGEVFDWSRSLSSL